MGKYIVKRLLLMIPALILVCVIVFVLLRIVPGSAIEMMTYKLSLSGIQVDEQELMAKLGYDKPWVTQFVTWIGDFLRGEMGTSLYSNTKVSELLLSKIPVSLELGIMTLILTNLISIPLGLFCASHQDAIGDNAIRVISIVLMSVPAFWIGELVLIYPAVWFGYAPSPQYISLLKDPVANLNMFLPPAIIGALTQAGAQIRAVRTLTIETMRQDYIRAAWAKGDTEHQVMYTHAFRNALIPVITIVGGAIAMLISGSVILENLFNMPGMGQAVVSALNDRDYPVVQGCVLVFSIFTMLVNLIVDISYKWADPRIELE